jgi:hypothetical protein
LTVIDFASTRTTTDVRSAACARLHAAVIAQAVKDTCGPPTQHEKKDRTGRYIDPDACSAIRFLFGGGPEFPRIAGYVGASAEAIRAALLHGTDNVSSEKGRAFGDTERRMLRSRLRRYVMLGAPCYAR